MADLANDLRDGAMTEFGLYAKAATAAAYEVAAQIADDFVWMREQQIETEKAKAAFHVDVPQIMRWQAGKVQSKAIADDIRALATPDQTAALDKLIAEAEARTLDAASAYIQRVYGLEWTFLSNPFDRQCIFANIKNGLQ